MGNKVQLKLWVDEDIRDEFLKLVVEVHGQKHGYVSEEGENAIAEYVDCDRYARIEERLDRIEGYLRENNAAHTHKHSEAAAKTEEIAERIGAEGRTVIPSDTVRRAIEDVAGADPRTIDKYEGQLKRRGLAFEHPNGEAGAVWTLDREQWLAWATAYLDNNPVADMHDLLRGYPLSVDDFDLVEVSA